MTVGQQRRRQDGAAGAHQQTNLAAPQPIWAAQQNGVAQTAPQPFWATQQNGVAPITKAEQPAGVVTHQDNIAVKKRSSARKQRDMTASIRGAIRRDIRRKEGAKIRAEIKEELRGEMREEVYKELREEMKAEIKEEMEDEVYENLRDDIWVELRAEVGRGVEMEIANAREEAEMEIENAIEEAEREAEECYHNWITDLQNTNCRLLDLLSRGLEFGDI